MIEYEVEIGERPLGVRFAHADRGETVVVHLVLENKVGHKLGLLPGDILIAINGKSVLDISSSEALELFRGQQLPFKASFRRFEDDDDFDSDEEEQSDTDLQSHFQQEDVNSIMHQLSTQPTHQKHQSLTIKDWTSDDVLEWLINFGKSNFNDSQRFIKYQKIFIENNIDGKALRQINKQKLQSMGVQQDDIQDLYRGIQQLNSIIFAAPNIGQLANQLKEVQDGDEDNNNNEDDDDGKDNDNDDDTKQDEDDEDDNWEAPFLPYMYDAPQVKLSDKTSVKVYSARVVSPYKKKAFALYEIEVCEGKDEWLLSKRYSEFYKLYEQMKKLGVKTKLNFPKKGIFYKSTDKQVMEDRKKKLTEYLNELLKDHPKARDSKQLSDFLSPSRTFVVDE